MKGIKVNLPSGVSGQTQAKSDYISLSVDTDGYVYFDKTKLEFGEILPRLTQLYQVNPDAKIFIRADREALHGNVVRLLNQLRSAGFYKVAFEIKSQAGLGVPAPGAR